MLDNHIYQGNELNIDPTKVVWKRCLDMNDRTLRSITIAQDKKTNGVERKDGFIITVATEIMAIMCLSKDLQDSEKRVSRAAVSYTHLDVYKRQVPDDDDARLPFDVYESGQGVPDQGLSGPAGFPDFQGHSNRQPVESGQG